MLKIHLSFIIQVKENKYRIRPSQLRLQNTLTTSLQRCKTPPMSVLDMTRNNLIVWFQKCWSFGECRVPLYCPLWPGVVAPDRVLSMGQIEVNCILMLN